MRYVFSKPKQEGFFKGKPFFVVEIAEYGKNGCLSRSKLSLEDAMSLLRPIMLHPYRENITEEKP